VRPEDFVNNVRADGTASYLELNPQPPRLSSRSRGWEGIVVERDRFLPFDNGVVIYDEHIIGFVIDQQARLSHMVDGRRYEGIYGHGDLLLSPGERPVRWRVEEEWDGLVMTINPEVIRQVAREMGLDASKVHLVGEPKVRDPLILQIGQALQSVLNEAKVGERLYVHSLRNVLATHLLRHHSSLSGRAFKGVPDRGLPQPKLRRAIAAIQDHLEQGISLTELAEATGVSASHFEVLFKRSTGVSPYQYLLRCRVERAKLLLRTENLSLVDVAARTGFCDQGHMSRHFKKIVGITPGGYRRKS
jgi:AraC family transcriptional regulator